MPKVKYPGEIGKPSPNPNLLAAVFRLYANGKGDYGVNRAIQYAEDERHYELMLKLLDYYRIEASSPHRWLRLAYALACDNVPAFQFSDKRPGAPRKMGQIRDLMSIGRKRGRPKTRSDNLLKSVLSNVLSECEKHGFRGHGAITRALESFIRDYAKCYNLSATRSLARDLAGLQKLVSEAKRKFPEIAAKLPR